MISDQSPAYGRPRVRPARLCVALAVLLSLTSLLLTGCAAQTARPKFDADKSFAMLKKQCDFGPRYPGSEAHRKLKDALVAEMKKHSNRVAVQSFRHKWGNRTLDMWNVIASFGPAEGKEILLCAHWDTRPTADQEIELADQKKPIMGANDGGSGVAVLLELARIFKQQPPKAPVTIVLFDGEDLGPTVKDMFLGSRYYASRLDNPRRIRYGILLDMIGDKELRIYRERNSDAAAPEIVGKVWKTAARLGFEKHFIDKPKYDISDDHLPFIERGVPCVDVIDFDYAHWHTLEDTIDKCSPESLRIVGETIAEVVYSEQTSD